MVKKVAAGVVLAGALTMATATAASAAPTFPPVNCANAPTMVARIQAEEAKVGAILAQLQAQAAQHPRNQWVMWPIAFLTRVEAFLAAEVSQIEAQCPAPSSSSSSGLGIVA